MMRKPASKTVISAVSGTTVSKSKPRRISPHPGSSTGSLTESSRLLNRRKGDGAGGEGGGESQHRPGEEAVKATLKLVPNGLSWTLSFWLLGILSVMLRYSNPEYKSAVRWVITFMPFWIGDVAAGIYQAQILRNAYSLHFMTSEQRSLLNRYGPDSDPGYGTSATGVPGTGRRGQGVEITDVG
ncbi:unnamed protein product [Chrysoparadoxa australica]